jgi:uncharacterized protein YwbE
MLPFSRSAKPRAWRAHTLAGLEGLVLGAGLMYLFDPEGGRRRRHEILRRSGRLGRESAEGTGRAFRDVRNRATGLVAALRRLFRHDEATGERLAARVRARLGRVVSHPHAIDVSAEDGRVVLAGPILAEEVKAAVAEASRVRGVEHLDNRLDVFETPDDVPALQGGVTRTGNRPELLQANWAPGVRLLTVVGASALLSYAVRRRDPVGAGIGFAGATLAARALSNKQLGRLVSLGE